MLLMRTSWFNGIIKLCYGSSLPDPSQFLEKISEQTNTQSENKQTKVSEIQLLRNITIIKEKSKKIKLKFEAPDKL